jgi:competence ComEA-like helix-hairpin-helix protein
VLLWESNLAKKSKRSQTRLAFTRGEIRALIVLAALLIIGLVTQQIRRTSFKDSASVVIAGAERIDEVEALSLIEKHENKDAADSSSLDKSGSVDVPSKRRSLSVENGDSKLNVEQEELDDDTNLQDIRNRENSEAVKPFETSRFDLNRATLEDFETLSGIGPVLSKRIIDWRKKHGSFIQVEDLLLVEGIGEKRFALIKPYVTVIP